jgi:hypothetical protein
MSEAACQGTLNDTPAAVHVLGESHDRATCFRVTYTRNAEPVGISAVSATKLYQNPVTCR